MTVFSSRPLRFAAVAATVATLSACASMMQGKHGDHHGHRALAHATADIAGPGITGKATLTEIAHGQGRAVHVRLEVQGDPKVLTPGLHGVHFHQTGDCGNGFKAAGDHFDPGPAGVPAQKNHPFHMGDMPNMEVDERGVGRLEAVTTRVTISEGPVSLFDADGSSLMIHAQGDELNAQMAGGARIACGVLRKAN